MRNIKSANDTEEVFSIAENVLNCLKYCTYPIIIRFRPFEIRLATLSDAEIIAITAIIKFSSLVSTATATTKITYFAWQMAVAWNS